MTERTANIALHDYNQQKYETRMAWERVLGQAKGEKVLAKPTTVRKAPQKNKSFLSWIFGG